MRLTQFLAAAAAFSLAAAPAVAAPTNPAAKLSLASQDGAADPADTATTQRKQTYLLAGLGVVAIILLAVAMGGNGGDSDPASA